MRAPRPRLRSWLLVAACAWLGARPVVVVAAEAPPADAPTVTARLDRSEGKVGDVLTLSVTAVGPRATPVNLPASLDLNPLTVLEQSQEEKDLGDGRMSRSFTLKVAAYETGALTVPPVEVTYIGKDGKVLTVKTAALPLKITSLIANEPEPALKELAPPVVVMEQDLTLAYIAGGLGAAGLGALLALHLRRKMRARAAYRPAPPPRPAHEVALEKLDHLARSGFTADADLRLFYFQLSEVLREYFGARFGFEALEMTTEELVAQLERRAPRGLIMGEIAGWLSGCDLVKFAKLAPTAAEARGALETAIRLVESTRPRPAPEAPAVAAPTEGAHA
jgi:hypothetical protein